VRLPDALDPAAVRAVAMDLDRTILGPSLEFTDALVEAVAAVEADGIIPVIATGRMFRSARRYAQRLGLTSPLVCYQGALVADPNSGEWLLHEPLDPADGRELIADISARGFHINVYVDDELYVAELNRYSEEYANHARLEAHAVGDLAAWLSVPTTKIVVVGDPGPLDELNAELQQRYGSRFFIAKSLPTFLEVARAGVSKGSGLHFVCNRLGISAADVVAFGDGANDIELLEEAGTAVAVENGDPLLLPHADVLVPGVEEDGVARFLQLLVDSRRR
jgi:Cof subfamily protein (haloacid dehalogenase superfamily)